MIARLRGRAITLGAALGTIAALVALAWLGPPDSQHHERVLRSVWMLAQLDRDENEYALLARSSSLLHYDLLSTAQSRKAELWKVLERDLRLEVERDAELARAVESTRQALASKDATIERFKQSNSMARNSLQFVPTLTGRILSERGASEIREIVPSVLAHALAAGTNPNGDALVRLREDISRLRVARSRAAPGSVDVSTEALVLHAEKLSDVLPSLNAEVDRLTAAPTRAGLEAVESAHARLFDAALASASRARSATYAICVALAIWLILSLYRLWAREDELDERVRERTAALERGNRELAGVLTSLKSTQEKLVIADRLSAVGQLAAGIAHEINNPLAYVSANLEFVRAEIAEQQAGGELAAELLSALCEASDGVRRVGAIVKSLKAFSRVSDDERGVIDIRDVMEMSLRMAANELKHRARVETHFGEVPPVFANAGRLGQVALNLLVNAAQAIPEGDPGRNVVRVVTRTDERCWAVFEVHDTGAGIPENVREHIFDPFFTTKPIGVGTGLGLSICHGIVVGIGGEIRVDTQVGRGTCFSVLIPPSAEIAQEERSKRVPQVQPAALNVLIIDDDPLVGSGLGRTLGRRHRVDVISSAREALGRLRAGAMYDLILCDLMMPDMTGMDFHDALGEFPEVRQRVAYMTGGVFSARARAFIDSVDRPLLAKPFTAESVSAFLIELRSPSTVRPS